MTLPLTAAQRALWVAQLTIGEVPLTVAQSVRISGRLDAAAMIDAMRRAWREAGLGGGRVVAGPDGPALAASGPELAVESHDLRTRREPRAAAERWMAQECARPIRLDDDLPASAALLRVGDGEWFLFNRAHHLLLDGYGALAVMRRAAALYRAATHGDNDDENEDPGDDPVAPPAAALLDADREYREAARFGRDRDYWQERLRDLPEPVALGEARALPSADPLRDGGDLTPGLESALERCRSALAAHASVLLIAGIGAFIARLADRDRVVVSLPVPARASAVTRAAAGSASNLVPLVISATPGISLRDFVAEVSAAISGALRHQRYRHEDMLRDSGSAVRSLHQFGPVINLFPVLPEVDLGGLAVQYRVLSTGPVLDLNINVYPTDRADRRRIDLEANPAAFSAAAVAALHRQLLGFLERFAQLSPEEPIDRLALGRPEPGTHAPPPTTLAALLAEAPADATLAVLDGDLQLTYRGLQSRAEQLAERLRRRGAHPETRVATLLPRSADAVVAAWAIALTGACYVPVDPRFPDARIAAILTAADCRLVVARRAPPVEVAWMPPDGSDAPDPGPPCAEARARPSNAAYLIFTSGSTGAPKGVVVTGSGLAGLAATIRDGYALTSDSVLAHVASPSFDTAIVEILAAALGGATLVVVPAEVVGGAELATLLAAARVTHLLITPTALATVPTEAVPALRSVLAGGEVCPPATAERWISSGRRFRCAYGPTETTCCVTVTGALGTGDCRPRVPIGTPLPGVRALVLDHRLRPQPPGAIGELYVGGPALARGYLSPVATAQRFVADPSGPAGARLYRTGDLVARRADGTYDFRGRTDDQLKLRGIRVEPAEVDTALCALPGVSSALTVGVRRDGSVVALASYVTGDDPQPARLRAALSGVLPSYLVPSTITVVDQFARTTTGKVDQTRLPPPAVVSGADYRLAADPVEHDCVDAFAAVTGVRRVGADDDFFALGGDSLSALDLVAAINAATGASTTVRDVIEARTPAGLAAVIRAADLSPIRHASTGPLALAPAQRNVDFADRGPAHVIPFTVQVPAVDLDALRAALGDLAAAHSILCATVDDGRLRPGSAPPIRLDEFSGDARTLVHAGFDLRTEAPVRVGWQRRGDEVLLAVALHHGAVDGQSLGLLAADLTAAYAARCAGSAGPAVTPPRIDYFDYTRWITGWLGDPHDAGSRFAAQLDYWRDELADLPEAFATPADRTRPTPWDCAGARRSYAIPPQRWAALHACARACQTTVFAAARGSIARYLCVTAEVPDVVVGVPVSGRRRSELDAVVGMFVNTVPLRYRIGAQDSLEQVVAGHVDTERRAHRHSDIAYLDVAAALGQRRTGIHPLFQVVVSHDDPRILGGSTLIPGLGRVTLTPLPPPIAKCDLHFSIRPPHDGRPAGVEVLYPTAMFDAPGVDRLVHDWLQSIGDE